FIPTFSGFHAMNNSQTIFLGLSLAFFSTATFATDYSLGIGFGLPYSGLGLNISVNEHNSSKFLSTGCIAHQNNSDNSSSACGIGLGWQHTINGSHHTAGLYTGIVSGKTVTTVGDLEAIYGLGITYSYYFQKQFKGLNLGTALTASKPDNDLNFGLNLQLGYQL
ncbi:MAG: hypothetical protein Q9N68_04510, partial [Gammaproteobacteria bacterium]|nr:hypothetical protein [Gammaproteobacteria bacterium]